MCTATWWHGSGVYRVWFNRDELRTRLPARVPEPGRTGSTRFLAPRDGDAGGTWIGANQHGLTLCLLNNYAPDRREPGCPPRSRGLLVLDLMGSRSMADAGAALTLLDLRSYRPFHLVSFAETGAPQCHTWNGQRTLSRSLSDEDLPLTNAAVHGQAVHDRRAARLRWLTGRAGGRPGPATLDAFHHLVDRSHPARGIVMFRKEAATVSITCVSVTPEEVSMTYEPVDLNRMRVGPAVTERLAR
jgi:hypothetical protein